MSSYIQGGGFYAASLRAQDHGNADQKVPGGGGEGRHGNSTRYSTDAPSSRSGLKSYHRGKRPVRGVARGFRPGRGISVFIFLVLCIVSITIIGGDYLFSFVRSHKGGQGSFRSHDFFENQDGSSLLSFWNRRGNPTGSMKDNTNWEDDVGHGNYYHNSKKKRALQFGEAFVQKEELVDRDSRYWDKDDRRRDRFLDYDDMDLGTANTDDDAGWHNQIEFSGTVQDKDTDSMRDGKVAVNAGVARRRDMHNVNREFEPDLKQGAAWKLSTSGSGGLYNERGRKELRIYEEQLEAALEQELDSSREKHALGFNGRGEQRDRGGGKNTYSQVGNEGRAFNANANQPNLTEARRNENTPVEDDGDDEYDDAGIQDDKSAQDLEEEDLHVSFEDFQGFSHQEKLPDHSVAAGGADDSVQMKATNKALNGMHAQGVPSKRSRDAVRQQQQLSRNSRRHRRAGYPCEIDFLETTHGLHEPEPDPRFENFSLTYLEMEDPQGAAGLEPRFAGHQTLLQRNRSFIATDQTLHCGFVQAAGSSRASGFDLAEEDTQYLGTCKIAVSSCIFGSSDSIRSPRNRKFTGSFKNDVCFVMFVDQQTLDVIKQEGQQLDERGYLGSWKVVVVRNMPYADARRVGKIPKFLTHRLFPAARYSIWLDSKLRLQNDPVLILEYFLWRGGHEYAISNHYDRHCVWEEVQQNKKLNKYNHTAIDEQFAFYQADGLTRFNASDPKRLLRSNVPEGSFIIRAHTPMSNLFSCLWFNEVDRFTSRDQLSFAYTYKKLVRMNPNKHFYLNMFKDCERKSIAKLFRHRKNGSSSIQGQVHQEEVVVQMQ